MTGAIHDRRIADCASDDRLDHHSLGGTNRNTRDAAGLHDYVDCYIHFVGGRGVSATRDDEASNEGNETGNPCDASQAIANKGFE
jgi:hypothetical protein